MVWARPKPKQISAAIFVRYFLGDFTHRDWLARTDIDGALNRPERGIGNHSASISYIKIITNLGTA